MWANSVAHCEKLIKSDWEKMMEFDTDAECSGVKRKKSNSLLNDELSDDNQWRPWGRAERSGCSRRQDRQVIQKKKKRKRKKKKNMMRMLTNLLLPLLHLLYDGKKNNKSNVTAKDVDEELLKALRGTQTSPYLLFLHSSLLPQKKN
ncbi:hypothetical protein GEV33_005604 [Tenebrio molitor]|uniref:Uncharacterized protein n=1 Tax=Tenebrio molitor TaxID=7067 RepID=A0A8J6HML7_TENMO|nr:hypothetical protein GEV33_005604 [Tenebrio molitor]